MCLWIFVCDGRTPRVHVFAPSSSSSSSSSSWCVCSKTLVPCTFVLGLPSVWGLGFRVRPHWSQSRSLAPRSSKKNRNLRMTPCLAVNHFLPWQLFKKDMSLKSYLSLPLCGSSSSSMKISKGGGAAGGTTTDSTTSTPHQKFDPLDFRRAYYSHLSSSSLVLLSLVLLFFVFFGGVGVDSCSGLRLFKV